MSSVAGVLMRRGAEAATSSFQGKKADKPNGGLMALFFITVVLVAVIFWSIEYTYGMLIATLAAVEDTNPDIYVRIASNADDPIKPADDEDVEFATATPPMPITSKLRTTVKHLRDRAGFWSRFRGLGMFLAYSGLRGFLSSLVPVSTSSFVGQFFVQSFLSVALATWQMAWVHIVISEPSPKRWYQRIPSYKTWIKIAPAAALEDVLTSAAFFLPISLAGFAGWLDIEPTDDTHPTVVFCRFMGATLIPAILAFLLTIPARVIFVRVAASMLPEEDETIVPFDRSFGGKVNPAITGGSGKIGIVDAWTTFDWAARVRLVKVIGKTFAIEVAFGFLAALVLVGQIILMFSTAKPAN